MLTSPSSKCVVLSLLALGCLGAQGDGRMTRFAGKTIPDPPGQKESWTPPPTKLPRFLVAATSALFDQGVADPRGCEYREVELLNGLTARTQAFVLPERPGEPHRFAVAWDGEIYPAASVGPPADLDAGIRALVDSRSHGPPKGAPWVAGGQWHLGAIRGRFRVGGPPGPSDQSALKLCLLLRLGRADLAEQLFAATSSWTPEIRGRDFTDYHVNYLSLAREWAAQMYLRLVDAHVRGDDTVALDTARRLSAFVKAAEARAKEMGFEWDPIHGNGRAGYFPFLRQLPELLADQERRAREPARGPIPPRGADPAARVAALIRDLDQIAEPQQFHFGNNPASAGLVQALQAEGDAAVGPLLAAIETDTRLTRTVSFGRGMTVDRRVHPVLEAEVAALRNILGMHQFPGDPYQVEAGMLSRKDLARPMREFWEKSRGLSQAQRWYCVLLDDSAGTNRWIEAAGQIVQPTDRVGQRIRVQDLLRSGETPMKGDELRSRRDPGVSELMARRALQIACASQPQTTPEFELQRACDLALLLQKWDAKAALPVIRALMAQIREILGGDPSEGYHQHDMLVVHLTRFALIRTRAGDRAALAEYAAEIRKGNPKKDQLHGIDAFEPMWTYPDEPSIREAARWLFNNPDSPWAAFLRKPGSAQMHFLFVQNIYASPLLRVPEFREAVLAMLADRSAIGTARRSQPTMVEYEIKDGVRGSTSPSRTDLEEVEQGVEQTIRACDYIAWQIATTIEGSPRFVLCWPAAMRDAAVKECAGFLKIFGDRFTDKAPPGERFQPFQKTAHLAFPALDHPATKADVRAGRAIFSLEGEGEVRRIALPSLPMRARWRAPDADDAPAAGGGAATFEEGWVWQAEEVRRGGQWERYYGFVGRHVIARVPAGSIELPGVHPPEPGAP